jgi:hypothetical protein
MSQGSLSERDVCTKLITPALERAGWDIQGQVREEVSLTAGQVMVRGRLVARGTAKRADYVLYLKPNLPLAVIEATTAERPQSLTTAWTRLLSNLPTVLDHPDKVADFKRTILELAFAGRLAEECSGDTPVTHTLQSIEEGWTKTGREPLPDVAADEIPASPSRWRWIRLGNLAEVIGGVTKGRDLKGRKLISAPYHSFAGCGWHYDASDSFDTEAAQQEWRDLVNTFIKHYGDGFELSAEGEVVRLAPDGLAQLFDTAVPAPAGDTNIAKVETAVRMFRRGLSSRVEQKEAVRNLVDLLEFYRPKVSENFLSKDEKDLFIVANGFAIRHHHPSQKDDYDDSWLRWLFYFYLATVHLVLELVHGQEKPPAPQQPDDDVPF